MKKTAIIICFAIALLMMVAGCHSTPQKYMATKEEAQKQTVEQKSGIANPASTFCINQSGNGWSTKEDSSGNQYGICSFPDGSWCEEWAYFRGYCAPGLNYTKCEGQFTWKTSCPQDYNPVCGLSNSTGEWTTFGNNCKACLASEGNSIGYVIGTCD